MKYLFLVAILSTVMLDASARTIPRGTDKNGNPLPCPKGYIEGANNTYCKELGAKDKGGMGQAFTTDVDPSGTSEEIKVNKRK